MTADRMPHFELLAESEAIAAAVASASGCFQQYEWVRAVAAARARPHAYFAVRAHRGDQPPALLFGAVHRRWGVAVFESMPMGGYGGWMSDSPLAADDERNLTECWLRWAKWPVVELTSRPGRGEVLPSAAPARLWPRRVRERLAPREFTTQVLDLSGDEAELLRRTRTSVRSYLRRVDDLGFAFERADDHGALVAMHRWYCSGSREWQQPGSTLPEAFFTSLERLGYAEVWTVRFHGRIVGAALFLVGRHEVQYQASGTERIDSTLSAMDALIWAAARHYRQRGLATMNLGASDGLESVARFKKKFGAQSLTYLRATYILPGRARLKWLARSASPGPT